MVEVIAYFITKDMHERRMNKYEENFSRKIKVWKSVFLDITITNMRAGI